MAIVINEIAEIPYWVIFLHPMGLTLFITASIFITMFVILIWRTPAMTFLKGSILKRMLLINPLPNRMLTFKLAKPFGSLSHVKGRGYYITDPDNVYIEHKSKSPCSINFSRAAVSINPQMAKVADFFEELGVKNYDDLKAFFQLAKEEGLEEIKIAGSSIALDKVQNYFSRDDTSDVIEAEVQRRTAAEAWNKAPGAQTGNVIKWLIGFGILLVCAGLAYAIMTTAGTGTGSEGLTPSQLDFIVEQLQPAQKVVTNATGTQIG